MTETKNPSQEEPSGGVFDSIQGAHSRDPDAVEEPAKTETAAPEEPAKAGETAKEAGDERLGKATQRIAQLERQINQIGPWAQFGMAVGAVKGQGEALVERYQGGQPLFVAEAEGESTVEEQPKEQPLTEQRLANVLDQREATRRLMGDLTSMAEEQLPEFKKISRGSEFAEMLDWARNAVWRGGVPLDESVVGWDNDFAAKEYTALKKAYTMRLASDPKVREVADLAMKKQKADREAEAAAVPSLTGTQTTSSQEEPAEATDADESVKRMLKAGGIGKSFGSI